MAKASPGTAQASTKVTRARQGLAGAMVMAPKR